LGWGGKRDRGGMSKYWRGKRRIKTKFGGNANVRELSVMKQCLNCKKEFEYKRDSAKFCSDKCRAAYNRTHPQQMVSKVQLQVLYNEMLELIKKAQLSPQQPYFGVATNDGVKWGQTQDTVKIRLKRPFLTLQALINECQSMEEYEPLRVEIEEADHLTRREKDILLRKR
jgi:hypothetical protein